MECKFTVGQKVVCVNNTLPKGKIWGEESQIPVVGNIYTIEKIYISVHNKIVNLDLKEISRGHELKSKGYGYGAFRFQPLEDKKTDISVFHQMLKRGEREATHHLAGLLADKNPLDFKRKRVKS